MLLKRKKMCIRDSSNGILMDKITVSGGIIQLGYRDMADQGAGWVAANSMCWQGRASPVSYTHLTQVL